MYTNSSPPSGRFLRGEHKSQGAVEFALAFPIFLMIVFGIIDFSLLFSAWLLVQNVARQAVRYAATGQYDTSYCAAANLVANGGDGEVGANAGCAGTNKNVEVDYARLRSIHDVADSWRLTLFIDPATLPTSTTDYTHFTEHGFAKVNVCSSRDRDSNGVQDYVFFPSHMGGLTIDDYAKCTMNGVTTEDPGGPNDRVLVSVDFNHPFLTPFINAAWPMFHLSAYREAIVEKFRVSRIVSVPPIIALPTDPFTLTPTPTETLTPLPSLTSTTTLTPTATMACPAEYSLTRVASASYTGSKPRISFTLTNNNPTDTAYIRNMSFDWDYYDHAMPTQNVANYKIGSHNAVNATSTISPLNVTIAGNTTNNDLAPGTSATIIFTFGQNNKPISVPVNLFGLSITMSDGCVVTPILPDATPTTTVTPTITMTPTVTMTPTITLTPTKTLTPTLTFTPTPTFTPTLTFTPSKTLTPTLTPTPTFTPTITLTPTRTFTPTITFTPTKTFTPTVTLTPTLTPTITLTPVPPTITKTPTKTLTPIPPTLTFTPTITLTPLPPTITKTPTITFTPLPPTFTPTRTPTKTPTFTPGPTNTPTPTITSTPTTVPTKPGGGG